MHNLPALSPPPHTPPREGTIVQGDGCATSVHLAAQTATPQGGSVVQPHELREEIKRQDENLFNFITSMQKTFGAKLTYVELPNITIGAKYPKWADVETKTWINSKPVGVHKVGQIYRGRGK